jgi:Protein of unknown function (DUF1592)/Protein of unknown function (DUF1588)/Protein of unknown function (DUF1595)/Protein of unknown function (DUF1587)/Protein of unknown function (DUF1585)
VTGLALLAGCTEAPAPHDPRAPGTPAADCDARIGPRLRRLSNREYQAVLADLLEEAAPAADLFAPDARVDGFDNHDALSISGTQIDDYAATAQSVAAAFPVGRLAPCAPDDDPDDCAAGFIARFARRAYGRPLAPSERAAFAALFAGAAADGYQEGVRLMVEALLDSPHFLYRLEIGVPAAGGAVLDPYELASVLSFAVTGSRPDEALLAAAEAGQLADGAGRAAEVARLLGLPQGRRHLARFVLGWLGVGDLQRITRDQAFVPGFSPALRADMIRELEQFVDDALAGGGSLPALFTTPSRVASPALTAAIYAGDAQAPAAETLRKGVLSLPAFLTAHATIDRTSPVERGLFVVERLFCAGVPPPPAAAQMQAIAPGGDTTTREKQLAHETTPACRACHSVFDPIGFGFEQMDAIGRFRLTDNGAPVDSSGALVGTDVDGPFTGPAELAERLMGSAAFRSCLVRQLFRFVEGHREGDADRCALKTIGETAGSGPARLSDLLQALLARPGLAERSRPKERP